MRLWLCRWVRARQDAARTSRDCVGAGHALGVHTWAFERGAGGDLAKPKRNVDAISRLSCSEGGGKQQASYVGSACTFKSSDRSLGPGAGSRQQERATTFCERARTIAFPALDDDSPFH